MNSLTTENNLRNKEMQICDERGFQARAFCCTQPHKQSALTTLPLTAADYSCAGANVHANNLAALSIAAPATVNRKQYAKNKAAFKAQIIIYFQSETLESG